MKPITLTLCGWGPFRDSQTVDFTKLSENGIFLITGQTGAGKTTVFDGITYALYGNMSGEIREKNSVRSDFAEDDTPTFAELVMQHNGEVYRIYRNPEYLRPKKRKNGKAAMTKEREKAVLTLPDGTAGGQQRGDQENPGNTAAGLQAVQADFHDRPGRIRPAAHGLSQ
ncbi:MAG: AAA family ATPase [Eisenbergiella massiliensis]